MAEHQVLFCPFCRESFEGLETCPEHELGLVSFERLPPDVHEAEFDDDQHEADSAGGGEAHELQARQGLEDRELALLELRHGRGLVAVGALLNLLALSLPIVQLQGAATFRTFELARARPSLWTLALVSFTALYVLARRRTLRRLRGQRVLVPLLALLSPLTLLAVLRPIASDGALGLAVYVVAVAALLMAYGGVRLGSLSRDRPRLPRTPR